MKTNKQEEKQTQKEKNQRVWCTCHTSDRWPRNVPI